MQWVPFHHSDWSLPVVRRRVGEELLDLISGTGELLMSGGRSVIWRSYFSNRTSYNNALYRLKKAGLVVRSTAGSELPTLKLTEAGTQHLPVYYRPQKEWDNKWNGIWYVLIFDIPETERCYRDSLRRFLKSLRMGCLQKSVWITPRDIRPEYHDLEKVANVYAVSYLLESRTVLHRETAELVRDAWGFCHLHDLHDRYLSTYSENICLAKEGRCNPDDLMSLLRQESEAYIQCMRTDPLLPSALLPDSYLGREVFALRMEFRNVIADLLLE